MPTEQTTAYCRQCRQQSLFTRPGFDHTLHLLLSVFLCGCWLPIWFVLALMRAESYRCTRCGWALY